MHLRQPGFMYSACGPFTKNKERIQKFEETGDSRYVYQNELDKACFQHDMRFNQNRFRFRDKAFNSTNNPYARYQHVLTSLVYKCFDKKSSGGDGKSKVISNQQLAEKLHKPNIQKNKKKTNIH